MRGIPGPFPIEIYRSLACYVSNPGSIPSLPEQTLKPGLPQDSTIHFYADYSGAGSSSLAE